jgi:hypothetical protein
MANQKSAKNFDSSLHCAYFGGPRDGFRSGDLPASLTGQKLTGSTMRVPLSQPSTFSLFAVYVCTSDTQVDGFWEFHFVGMEGPNGEKLIAAEDDPVHQVHAPGLPSRTPEGSSHE